VPAQQGNGLVAGHGELIAQPERVIGSFCLQLRTGAPPVFSRDST
jgi:hypothetical protein